MRNVLIGIGAALAFVALTVVLMVYGFGMEMFGLELGKHVENKRTDVTRQTNQFVTSQQQQLATFARAYKQAEEAGNEVQMKMTAEQMDQIATTLDPEYLKGSWIAILVKEGYDY